MANTLTLNEVRRGRKQFTGFFASDMWTVKATWADQDAIAINDTLAVTMAVPGVELGDMCLGVSFSEDLLDAGGDGVVVTAAVSAANFVTLYLQADVAEFAVDTLNGVVVKVLVVRPVW